MRFRILGLFLGLILSINTQAQQYGLEVEVTNDDIGVLIGALGVVDLSGWSTTRLYVTMENADDFMSSVSGDANNPTIVNTTTNFYHATLGAVTPTGINSLLFPVYPDLAFDSWVTIGLQGVPNAVSERPRSAQFRPRPIHGPPFSTREEACQVRALPLTTPSVEPGMP